MTFNRVLWAVQVLLACVFLVAGGSKLVLSMEAMAGPVNLPEALLRFIGVMECLGAIGLILPGLLGIRPGLTPLAAIGLTIIMAGATVITAMGEPRALALLPFCVGLLAVFVVYGRRHLLAANSFVHTRTSQEI